MAVIILMLILVLLLLLVIIIIRFLKGLQGAVKLEDNQILDCVPCNTLSSYLLNVSSFPFN